MKSSNDDLVLAAARSRQRSLVDEVREIRAGHAGRARRDLVEIDVGRERNLARVHLENQPPPRPVRRADGDSAVEAAGPKERLVEDVRTVGRGDHDEIRRRA